MLHAALPILTSLHEVRKATIDFTYLSESLTDDEVFESVDLHATDPKSLLTSLNALVHEHPRVLVTALFIDLDTHVIDDAEPVIAPESAQFYVGTNVEAVGHTRPYLHVSYSTYIDVWVEETLGQDKVERDNVVAARENNPRLRQFLARLEQALRVSLSVGESYYYSDIITSSGFHRSSGESQSISPVDDVLTVQSSS